MTEQYRGPRNQRLPCPSCHSQRTHIYECRSAPGETAPGRRRRYVCKDCQTRFSSVEIALRDTKQWGADLQAQLIAQILDDCPTQSLLDALARRIPQG